VTVTEGGLGADEVKFTVALADLVMSTALTAETVTAELGTGAGAV
jgi:hypothetical protein